MVRSVGRIGGTLGLGLLVFSSCVGQQSRTALDEMAYQMMLPIVEAYIEYGGPQEKWAGPETFLLHIDARESTPAQLSMTPLAFQEADYAPVIRGGGRMPASMPVLSAENVRERLASFLKDFDHEPEPFHGCLTPLRVRLVSASGSVFERQGCRGTKGWAKSASKLVADFMASAAQAQADRDAALAAEQAQAAGN